MFFAVSRFHPNLISESCLGVVEVTDSYKHSSLPLSYIIIYSRKNYNSLGPGEELICDRLSCKSDVFESILSSLRLAFEQGDSKWSDFSKKHDNHLRHDTV